MPGGTPAIPVKAAIHNRHKLSFRHSWRDQQSMEKVAFSCFLSLDSHYAGMAVEMAR